LPLPLRHYFQLFTEGWLSLIIFAFAPLRLLFIRCAAAALLRALFLDDFAALSPIRRYFLIALLLAAIFAAFMPIFQRRHYATPPSRQPLRR